MSSRSRLSLIDFATMKWRVFWYNFQWPDYVWALDGWIARASLVIPLLGYLIIFNDTVAGYITSFTVLGGPPPAWHVIDGSTRLKMMYLGLVALAAANALYFWRRPRLMKWGTSEESFIDNAMRGFKVGDFVRINSTIRERDALTQDGKYYTAEWDRFLSLADGERGGPNRDADFSGVHFEEAKARFGSLLRSMLTDYYFGVVTQHRAALVVCLVLAALGYLLLAIPALDLFLRVMSVVLGIGQTTQGAVLPVSAAVP